MSRHDVAVLTLRAFALYAWFNALEFFATGVLGIVLADTYRTPNGLTFGKGLSIFGPSVLFLGVGGFLFVRSRELASWLLPLPSEATTEQLPPHPLATASVAFAVVGLAIFLHAAHRVISYGITADGAWAWRLSTDLPQVIANAVQIILGLLLFLKSRTFATSWWRRQQPEPHE